MGTDMQPAQTIRETFAADDRAYTLLWITPRDLDDPRLPEHGGALRSTDDDAPYSDGLEPLYNIHCELHPEGHTHELADRLGRDGQAWQRCWRELAEALPADQPFACLALDGDTVAGCVRFFPADRAHLRAHEEEPGDHPRNKVLLIGAAAADDQAAQDGVDRWLLQRVAAHAREAGYQSVQGIGWCASRIFAAWGQQFSASVYEAAGFTRRAAHTQGDHHAFHDQLAGSHGQAIQRRAQADVDAGLTTEHAGTYHLMELDMTASPVKREGQRIWIEGVPHEHFDIHWDMHVNAARALLGFRGIDLSRAQVMAYSGDAFNLCHASHWQQTAYLGAPHDPMKALAEAWGFAYEALTEGHTGPTCRRHDAEQLKALTDAAMAKIEAEIEAGRPVIVGGCEDHCGTWTLAVGYDPATRSFCHVGTGATPDREAYRWWKIRGVAPGSVDEAIGVMDGRVRGVVREGLIFGWQANPAYLFKERRADPPSPRKRAAATLRLAVQLHAAEPLNRRNWGGVDYDFGHQAYQQWADELEALDYPADLEGPFETNGVEPASDWYNMGNMDMQVDQIVTGRGAAAAFCDETADVLPEAADPLCEAASHYRDEAELAHDAFAAFIPRFDGNDEPRTAYLSDRERCRAGAATIRKLLQHESSAIEAIECALDQLDAADAADAQGEPLS